MMRTEQEMFSLILTYAEKDENIRAVVLNGSRANPTIKKDIFQDYDIVYYVQNMTPLIRNQELMDYFGESMILQLPDDMGIKKYSVGDRYAYLMQFNDGNRIDLSISPLDQLERSISEDSMTVVLLDKDGRIENQAEPSDLSYRPQKPTEKMFADCCNEFWWLNPYIAKGLWRKELIYSKYVLDSLLRNELMKMLDWYFGTKTGFNRSMGKQGKFLNEVLLPTDWQRLEATYQDADFDHIWQSLFIMGDLFRKIAKGVADYFNFPYPEEDDQKVTSFIHLVSELPEDAESFDVSSAERE
jgi:aminoglycoside 6-adenylyltransferase